jgi:hypothetical protein
MGKKSRDRGPVLGLRPFSYCNTSNTPSYPGDSYSSGAKLWRPGVKGRLRSSVGAIREAT